MVTPNIQRMNIFMTHGDGKDKSGCCQIGMSYQVMRPSCVTHIGNCKSGYICQTVSHFIWLFSSFPMKNSINTVKQKTWFTQRAYLTLFSLNLYILYPLMPHFDDPSISLMTTFDALFILQWFGLVYFVYTQLSQHRWPPACLQYMIASSLKLDITWFTCVINKTKHRVDLPNSKWRPDVLAVFLASKLEFSALFLQTMM